MRREVLALLSNEKVTYIEFQGDLWVYEKPKVNVTQRSHWNSIYVTLSFMRKAEPSLLILSIDRLMIVDYSPHLL